MGPPRARPSPKDPSTQAERKTAQQNISEPKDCLFSPPRAACPAHRLKARPSPGEGRGEGGEGSRKTTRTTRKKYTAKNGASQSRTRRGAARGRTARGARRARAAQREEGQPGHPDQRLGRRACGSSQRPSRIRELGVWPCTAFLQHCVSASSATSLVGLSGLCR